MGAEVRERRMLEHDLRLAIARDELRLVYQPQRSIQNEAVTGFEALLRWKHPTTRRDIACRLHPYRRGDRRDPGDRRLGAEDGLPRGRNMDAAVEGRRQRLGRANLQRRLRQGTAPDPARYRPAARRLEIEITETALVRDFNRALATLRQIKALGIQIAMDDFGTGYSSLSNLRAFPFDRIKIDGSFIKSVNSNQQAATIVRAVLGLGRGLGLPVMAEGVETDAEFQFLQDELCDEVQGYLLGRPASIESFRHLTHGDAGSEPSGDLAVSRAKIA